jgi:hypothetical protein
MTAFPPLRIAAIAVVGIMTLAFIGAVGLALYIVWTWIRDAYREFRSSRAQQPQTEMTDETIWPPPPQKVTRVSGDSTIEPEHPQAFTASTTPIDIGNDAG